MNLRDAYKNESRDLVGDLPDRGRQGGTEGVRREAPAELAGQVARDAPVDGAPCLIGVATRTWHPDEVGDAGAPEPLAMWEEVARGAADDSGCGQAVLDRLDAIDIVYSPDLAVRRSRAPPRATGSGSSRSGSTTRASAAPRRSCSCRTWRSRSCASELDVALVVGAEALATQRRFKQRRSATRTRSSPRRSGRSPGRRRSTRPRSRTRSSRRG